MECRAASDRPERRTRGRGATERRPARSLKRRGLGPIRTVGTVAPSDTPAPSDGLVTNGKSGGRRGRVDKRARRRGFSLLEALVSAAVLGFALLGLVQMHTSSIRGTAKAEDIGRAAEIARQIADRLAAQPLDAMTADLPNCGSPAAPLGARPLSGCRATEQPGPTMLPLRVPCSRLIPEDAIADVANGVIDIPNVDPSEDAAAGAYRVDTLLSQHPNGGPGVIQLHVWVCWRDPSGNVSEVHTSRTRVEGFY